MNASQFGFPTGPFTEPLGDKTTAWVNVGSGETEWPDLQCHVLSQTPAFDFGLFTTTLLSISRQVGAPTPLAMRTSDSVKQQWFLSIINFSLPFFSCSCRNTKRTSVLSSDRKASRSSVSCRDQRVAGRSLYARMTPMTTQ